MFFSFIVDLYLLHLISILCWFGDSLAPPPLVIHLELVSFTGEQCDHCSYRYNATVMIISPDEGLRSLPRRSLYQPSSWMRS
ncbi:hypothetical protein F2Q69_00025046 [Brassica cretica]|uniref:Secreted protein n=1 Tax=Brassica cretica TaxID=69181 RepID=A0A8S9NL05_BRACR|nr:hypothetical protein F2Q69_00043757 [Brassica cretica]KAF3541628.1 hypothetical protein F2Q69_00025046 [Brassica cretica]